MCLEKCFVLSIKNKLYKFNLIKKLCVYTILLVFLQMFAVAQPPRTAGNHTAENHQIALELNGIVLLVNMSGSVGTGFFVGPHTVATALHNLIGFQGYIQNNIYFLHPETSEKIPFTSIRAMNVRGDMVLIDTANYESPFYYDLNVSPEEISSNSQNSQDSFYAIGFLEGKQVRLKGSSFYPYAKDNPFLQRMRYASLQGIGGTSGSPVISETGQVVGMTHIHEKGTSLVFSKIQFIREMLNQPSKHCLNSKCFRSKVLEWREDKIVQYDQGMYELSSRSVYPSEASEQEKQKIRNDKVGLAMSFLKASALQGYSPSAFEVARIYFRGLGAFEVDYQEFEKWITQSAQGGFSPAQHFLGSYLLYKRDQWDLAISWITSAIRQGFFGDLSTFFVLQSEIGKTDSEIIQVLAHWSELGHPKAQLVLASYLFKGDKLEQDIERARELLLSAVASEEPSAIQYLSHLYKNGLYGFPQDSQKASELDEKLEPLSLAQNGIKMNEGSLFDRYKQNFVDISSEFLNTCRGWLSFALK